MLRVSGCDTVGTVLGAVLIAVVSLHGTAAFVPSVATPSQLRPLPTNKAGRSAVDQGVHLPRIRNIFGVRSLMSTDDAAGTDSHKLILAEKALVSGSIQPAAVLVKGARIHRMKTMTATDFEKAKASTPDELVATLFSSVKSDENLSCEEVTLCEGRDMLVPAFINSHTHLAMGAMRGLTSREAFEGNVVEDLFFKLEGAMRRDDVRAFVRMGAWECLMSGVGTVWDHYYFADAIAEGLSDVGLTGTVAATLQDVAGPALVLDGCGAEASLQTTVDIHNNQELKEKGIVAALGPHATDTVSPDLWRTIADTASKLNIPIHSHVAQSIEELERSDDKHGCTPVTFLDRLGVLDATSAFLMVHCLFVTQKELDLLSADKHVLGLCPASALQFGFPCDYHVLIEVEWQGWVDRGLRVAVGTDCAASNDGNNVQQELRLMAGGSVFSVTRSGAFKAFEQSGSMGDAEGAQGVRQVEVERNGPLVEPRALPEAIWGVPGGLHSELPTGDIREGAFANLLLLRWPHCKMMPEGPMAWGDHPNLWPMRDPFRAFAFSDVAPAIDNMMVAGRWVGERGRYHESLYDSPKYKEHRVEADERFLELLSRIGLE